MVVAHKLLTTLLIGALASSTFTCHAFKPTSGILRSSKGDTAVIVGNTSDEFIRKTELPSSEVVRGGHCPEEEGFHLHKSDVVKIHGINSIIFAAIFFVETLGGM